MLAPAITGTGLAVFVTERSPEFATCTLADAELLPGFGSPAVGVTDAVCVMVDPDATFVFTFTTNVNVAVALTASVGFVQVSVPRWQVRPAGPVSYCATVFAGVVSESVIVLAAAGPPLATTCV